MAIIKINDESQSMQKHKISEIGLKSENSQNLFNHKLYAISM